MKKRKIFVRANDIKIININLGMENKIFSSPKRFLISLCSLTIEGATPLSLIFAGNLRDR